MRKTRRTHTDRLRLCLINTAIILQEQKTLRFYFLIISWIDLCSLCGTLRGCWAPSGDLKWQISAPIHPRGAAGNRKQAVPRTSCGRRWSFSESLLCFSAGNQAELHSLNYAGIFHQSRAGDAQWGGYHWYTGGSALPRGVCDAGRTTTACSILPLPISIRLRK